MPILSLNIHVHEHTHIPYKWTGCLVIGLGLVQLFYFLNVFPPCVIFCSTLLFLPFLITLI